MQYGVDDDRFCCFKSSLWTDRHKDRDTLTHKCSMVLMMIVSVVSSPHCYHCCCHVAFSEARRQVFCPGALVCSPPSLVDG